MAELGGGAGPQVKGITGGMIALLGLAIFINYVDRGNLATAAPLIKTELKLSGTQIGILLSAFFWTYTPGQILAGWLAEKINPYRTLALGVALWSIATALTGLTSSFVMLMALRLLLGVGESAAIPCASKLIGQHMPQHRLGAANSVIALGLSLGPAFGTFFGGTMMAHLNWRYVFIIFGLTSLLWLVPWMLTTRQASRQAKITTQSTAPSFAEILSRRATWGAGVAQFCGNYVFYFVITWLPLYLVNFRGFSLTDMAKLAGGIYLLYAASSVVAGWLSDRWIKSGGGVTLVRKTFAVASHIGMACGMLGCVLGDRDVSVVSLFVAGIFFGSNAPTLYAIGQTLGGPRAAGKFISVQNGLANIAGIIAPIVTGALVDRTHSFTLAFAIAGGVALVGALGWGVVIQRVEPLDWQKVRRT